MNKIPHKRFLQALICAKMPADDVLVEMDRWSLPFIPDIYNTLLADIKKKDISFFKSKNRPWIDRDVVDSLEVTPLLIYRFNYPAGLNTEPVKEAFDMLSNNNIRIMIYAMALADINVSDIELVINEKYDINASSGGVSAFLHYFFDLKDFTFAEKQDLEKSFVRDVNARRIFKVALRGNKDYTLWKLGANSGKSLDSMLREMMVDSFYSFKEKNKSDADVAIKFGNLALKLADKIDRIDEAANKTEDFFNDLEFENSGETNKSFEEIKTLDDVDVDTTPTFLKDLNEEAAMDFNIINKDKPKVNLDEYGDEF